MVGVRRAPSGANPCLPARRKRIRHDRTRIEFNLSVSPDLVAAARARGLNLSRVLEQRLTELLAAPPRDAFAEKNPESVAACNARIAAAGTFSDEHRRFSGLAQWDVHRKQSARSRDRIPARWLRSAARLRQIPRSEPGFRSRSVVSAFAHVLADLFAAATAEAVDEIGALLAASHHRSADARRLIPPGRTSPRRPAGNTRTGR